MTSRDSADLPMSSSEGKEDSLVHADSGATDSSEKVIGPEEWRPIDTFPAPGFRPGNVWVLVEGWEEHSGMRWYRRHAGLSRTDNNGFYEEDIRLIEKRDHMERGSGCVTHWMPIVLPPYPLAPGGEVNFSNEDVSAGVSVKHPSLLSPSEIEDTP